jgi:serine/threonine protein kinase
LAGQYQAQLSEHFKRVVVMSADESVRRLLYKPLASILPNAQVDSVAPDQVSALALEAIDLIVFGCSREWDGAKAWIIANSANKLPSMISVDFAARVSAAVEMMRLGVADYVDSNEMDIERLTKALSLAAGTTLMTDQTPQAVERIDVAQYISSGGVPPAVAPSAPDDTQVSAFSYVIGGQEKSADNGPRVETTVQLSGDAIRKLQQQYVEPAAKPNQPPQAPAAKEVGKKKQMDSGFSMGGKDRQDVEVDSHANEPSNPNGMPRQNQFEINERSYTEKDKSGKNAVAPFSGAWLRMPDSVEEQAWPFSAEDLEEGTAILGKYRVLEFLGVGGMASVFKAQRISDDRLFAIKLLDPTVSDDNVRKRFKLEFDLIQKIKHKNVVSMEEQVDEGQWIYTVMEYLPGGDLKSRIRRHLRREEAVRYASQIAASLEAAHKQGVLHRDLKPANVLFRSDGTLALVDFGGAKDTLDGGIRLTKEGQMIGTPYYASPEQATGAKMDKRSDLYALGVILFEMLEGRRPFIGDTSLQVLMAHVKDPVPLLSQEWDALNDVLAQLLAKSPADRFPDGQSVVMALSEASPGDVPADLLQG